MKKVVVVGGGAAGLMAAIAAEKQGAKVTLLEKNTILTVFSWVGRLQEGVSCVRKQLFQRPSEKRFTSNCLPVRTPAEREFRRI